MADKTQIEEALSLIGCLLILLSGLIFTTVGVLMGLVGGYFLWCH